MSMPRPLEFVVDRDSRGAEISVILIDWGVRESFHSLEYLNRQTVNRSRYELIWIEFYDDRPVPLFEAVRAAEAVGRPLLDKLVVMNFPRDFIFHKHRMYNLGIVLAEGNICVICDSDAMFSPTFIEKILAAFEAEPRSVVHLDEVRSQSRRFYPFNFPGIDEFLASGCPNWTGTTTRGLAGSADMLHEANYGACLAARRDDLVRIGGADEHLDYLGYICGPYDLTFRLVNTGLWERWLTDEYLYHAWHPGETNTNVDYQGPSDGLAMSSRALAVRRSGQVEPATENRAIRALRDDPRLERRVALSLLACDADAEWQVVRRLGAGDAPPQLIEKAYRRSFDVYRHRGAWYAIPTAAEPFDPARTKTGSYALCLRGTSREELEVAIGRNHRPGLLRRIPAGLYRRARRLALRCLKVIGFELDLPFDPGATAPQTVRPAFAGHDIVHFRGLFYGVPESQKPFQPRLAGADGSGHYVSGRSAAEVKTQILARSNVPRLRRIVHAATVLACATHWSSARTTSAKNPERTLR